MIWDTSTYVDIEIGVDVPMLDIHDTPIVTTVIILPRDLIAVISYAGLFHTSLKFPGVIRGIKSIGY